VRSQRMTVGQLSHRTGLSVKVLREYADLGLVRTLGRSAANYRLFDDSALSCVDSIGHLRGLGLTVAEIQQLVDAYAQNPGEPIGPHLARRLATARARTQARIAELQRIRERIDEFEADHRAELAGQTHPGWWPATGPG
jgi:MerR family transcriptional regulator, copper efflux regulator